MDSLPKPCRDQDLLDAADHLRSIYETLSPRERQVMALVTAGRLNKQVAGDLVRVAEALKLVSPTGSTPYTQV